MPNAQKYLKVGVSFQELDRIAYQMSDNEFAERMQKAKEELFKKFKHLPQEMIEINNLISHS